MPRTGIIRCQIQTRRSARKWSGHQIVDDATEIEQVGRRRDAAAIRGGLLLLVVVLGLNPLLLLHDRLLALDRPEQRRAAVRVLV